jgi:hypothetical protein
MPCDEEMMWMEVAYNFQTRRVKSYFVPAIPIALHT